MRASTPSAKNQGHILPGCETSRSLPRAFLRLLGYTFRPRSSRSRDGRRFVSFLPAVSKQAAKRMRQRVRRWRLHLRSDRKLEEIAIWVRPVLSGWMRYYGRFYPSKLRGELRTIDEFIVRWAMRKYKRFRRRLRVTWKWLHALQRRDPQLFAHWRPEPVAG
jgi:RNA-directed DNA polymerase